MTNPPSNQNYLDSLVNDLADSLGIFNNGEPCAIDCGCRRCFSTKILREAFKNEWAKSLSAPEDPEDPEDPESIVSFSRFSPPRGNTVIKLLVKASTMGDPYVDEGVLKCFDRHSEGEVCLKCALTRRRYPVTVLSLCSLILSLKGDLRWKSIHAEGYPEMGKIQLEGGFISDSVHVCNSLTGFNAIAHYAPWHKNNWIPTKFVSAQHGENLKEVTHWRVCPTVGT